MPGIKPEFSRVDALLSLFLSNLMLKVYFETELRRKGYH